MRADLIDHVFNYGVSGDQPISGDWTGQGSDSIGVFRNGDWHLDVDGSGQFEDNDMMVVFGQAGDLAVVGDWDGDGVDDLGVYRNGTFYLDTNGNRELDSSDTVVVLEGGITGGKPVSGDWDGDGRDEVGVINSETGSVDRCVSMGLYRQHMNLVKSMTGGVLPYGRASGRQPQADRGDCATFFCNCNVR